MSTKRKKSKKNPEDGTVEYTERGRSVLEKAAKALREKKPLPLRWTEKGEPMGDNGALFCSWCGVAAQKYASCNIRYWKDLSKKEELKKGVLANILSYITV